MRIRKRGRRPSLREYVEDGLWMAAMVCVAAILGVGMAFLVSLGTGIAFPSLGAIAIILLFVFLSYFAAGVIGALALWAIFPLRQSFLGFVLRGAVLVPIIYGVVGLGTVLLYVFLDINIMDYESPEEAWRLLGQTVPLFAVVGAVLGGPIAYYQHHKEQRP